MIGELFDRLQQVLGAILSFFYEWLTPALSEGLGYGLAIILLTITINLVVFPLTLKQTRATRAFTEIQPKIKKIQAEYKDDPQEMQRRLMETQREAGATPGGCLLPLLVQMPIWFALFRLLQQPFKFLVDAGTGETTSQLDLTAIHAISPDSSLGTHLLSGQTGTFLGMDLGTTPSEAVTSGLSIALPYLIMMALMVATQYVQQWHSTYGQARPDQKGAGTQQAITRIMPLFIGFISYNFPAGLVLYWSTSNVFRLGQQVLIFRIDGRPSPPGVAVKVSDPEPGPEGNASKKPQKGVTDQPAEPEGGTPKKAQQGATSKRRRRRRR
jgi:YidC/Oxa1 family membrane protein insertase